jgi:hypothetical protein
MDQTYAIVENHQKIDIKNQSHSKLKSKVTVIDIS